MFQVGVDIVELHRIRRAVHRHGERFLERVYTESELAYCRGDVARLAARWAAKEAMSKALGTGWRGIEWRELEVGREPSGRPLAVLHGRADALARELGLTRWSLSLSHGEDHAIAFVVAT
jgi:holo-[acyl-carrier protein] synthase